MTCGWPTPPRSNAPDPADRAPFGPGRLDRVRLLRLPLTLLLGTAPAPGLHPAWTARRLGVDRGEGRRTRRARRHHRHDPRDQHRDQTRQLCIADKNYYGRAFSHDLTDTGITILRPTRKGENPLPGSKFFKPLRQIIQSVNDTLKGQLDLEAHGGRTITGVCTRISQRILALTAAIWHKDHIGATIRRSLTAYDH